MDKKQIVFLYTELASYFLACIEELIKRPDIEVHIVRWSINKEAPFQFSISSGIKIYERNDFDTSIDLLKLVDKINPSVIYSSGWMDKGYLKVCKKYRSKIPVIVGFDNQWKGNVKQYIATMLSPFRILNHFSHCWIPGDLQYEYAVRLGFKKDKILNGFYCCDFNLFYAQYLANREKKKNSFPKRFIYVARYYEFKGIKDIWKAFIELQMEAPNDWELWCFGVGDIEPIEHSKIKHFGFVQPNEMINYLKDTGVFVLPSHFEPWGVVVHEFAAAGFPLIVSDAVGARNAFVDNKNGYIYPSSNVNALKEVLKKTMNKSNEELFLMGEHSVDKAKQITPVKWADTLCKLISVQMNQ